LKIAAFLAFFLGAYVVTKIPQGLEVLHTGITGWIYHAHSYTLSCGAIILISLQLMKRKASLTSFLMLCVYMLVFAINCVQAPSRGSIVSFTIVCALIAIYFRRELILKIKIRAARDKIVNLKIRELRRMRAIKIKPRYILMSILIIALANTATHRLNDDLRRGLMRITTSSDIIRVMLRLKAADEAISSISGRQYMMERQYEEFLKEPVFGMGFGNATEYYSYVHNYFLEVLFETGVIGAILFLCFIYKIIRRIFMIWRESSRTFDIQDKLMIIPVFLWIFSAIAGLSSCSLFDRTGLWLWAGLILSPGMNMKRIRFTVVGYKPEGHDSLNVVNPHLWRSQ